MKAIALTPLFSFLAVLAFTQSVPVFTSGNEGYKVFRIPAILKAPNGDLLAFCEGRVHGGADFGQVNIVMKRSHDKGKTWSALQVVATNGGLQAGNPAPVVDQLDPDHPDGRIFLFYCTGDTTEAEVRKGNGLREVWYRTSIDNGQTWSEATNITAQVHRPRRPLANPAYSFQEDWRSYATTPGHAVQLRRGSFRGRLFIPINHSTGGPQPRFLDYVAGGFYTDDHGKTFHLAADVPVAGGNESTAAELPDGRLMLNARNQSGSPRQRLVALSGSGGASWDTTFFDPSLPDPVCQGSLLELNGSERGHALVFCNNADTAYRNNLSLKKSTDGGRTWRAVLRIDGSPSPAPQEDATAYSDLVDMTGSRIGVLYERADYKEIAFIVIRP